MKTLVMSNIHISTSETYMHDSIKSKGFCPVCCKKNQRLRHGWIETKCLGCGNFSSIDDMAGLVRKRRNYIGLTRKEMAGKAGITSKTVSNYENTWPSKRYWQATKDIVILCGEG